MSNGEIPEVVSTGISAQKRVIKVDENVGGNDFPGDTAIIEVKVWSG